MSVLAVFGAIKNLISPKNKGADISNNAFTIARYAGIVMVACSILTTSKQFFGEPIQCRPTALPPAMFSSYCFMVGTETFRAHKRTENIPETHAHAGVSAEKSGERVVHSYYQWVPFILFFQAVLFYLPYRVWKNLEGGKVTKLLAKISNDPLTEVKLSEQVEGIGNFLALNPHWFTSFSRKMFVCELGILVLTVLQMYLLDLVFDGQFFSLGPDYMTVEQIWEHYKVVEEVFPLVTNCEMKYVGPSGSPVEDSGMCLLSINILNQKIFIVSWYLHIFVVFFTVLKVLFDISLFLSSRLRYIMLRYQAKNLPSHVLSKVNGRAGYGHYTLLMLIARNVDGSQFEALLHLLAEKHTKGPDYLQSFLPLHIPVKQSQTNEEFISDKDKQEDSSVVIMRRPRLMSG